MKVGPADLPRMAEALRNTAAWIEAHGAEALTSRMLVQVGQSAGERLGRVSKGGVSDPTGQRAVATILASEGLTEAQADLAEDLVALHTAAGVVIGRLSTFAAKQPKPEPAASDADEDACRQGCGDPKAPGRRGNCEACDRWLRRNTHTDGSQRLAVPADVIERRHARKAHVNGPLAAEETQ